MDDLAGLLDFAKTPIGQGLLATVAGGLSGARRGTPWNNVGRAGLAGLAGYSSAVSNEGTQELRNYQLQKIRTEVADSARKKLAHDSYKSSLPAENQALFDIAPDKVIENMPQFQKPQLVEVADQKDPLRTVKQWMKPGETQGPVAGYGAMPEILDPRVQEAKRKIAVAGRAPAADRSERPPVGYRFDAVGNLSPIHGGPSDPNNKSAKATTEGEKAAAGYGLRMTEAENVIDEVGTSDPESQKAGFIERVAGNGLISNASRSETRQQYRQGQEDWVRAKLRKESGAAIPTDEMDREIQTYFPQPGDKDAVITQKKQARATAVQAMGIAAGGAEPQMRAGTKAPKESASNAFDSLPKAVTLKGKTIRDTETGKLLRSNGMSWVEVK